MIEGKIIIIDDNKNVLSALELLLEFEYSDVQTISNPNKITSLKGLDESTVVLLDMNFSAGINTGNEGLFWLKKLKEKSPETGVIMMTAYGGVELAVKALKEGASDFILKPWINDKLLTTIKSVFLLGKSQKEVKQLKAKTKGLKEVINQNNINIIGSSKAIKNVIKLTKKVAKTDVNVLITGENGTGKELIARELHQSSNRKNEIFINVDMGSISETLFESELFGHVKGAFTDAKEERTGKFEAANKGTLFLDEIGNLSLQMQAKLLSAIQQKSIVKVGSNQPISVDIRLVCATNCNLEQMVADGLFREDLLYRINTIHIEIPPLREREGDILELANHFLKKFSTKYGKLGLQMNQYAEQKLMDYAWPGNIRELEHAMERSVILSDDFLLKSEDFLLNDKNQITITDETLTLEEMEKLMIKRALEKHNGNHSVAAIELGITRQTLYNKIKKL